LSSCLPRSITLLLLLGAFFGPAVSLRAAAMSKGFQRVMEAVVRIDVREVAYEAGSRRFTSGVGSGVILSRDGYILTNAHVASPRAVELNVTLASLEIVRARLIGWDHWTDLALLQLDLEEVRRRGLTFTAAEFGDSAALFAGQTVYAVGTPHGLTRTVTRGIISNPRRYFEDVNGVRGYETGSFNTWLQTDAAINPGNSGGPLVTENGRVIGINSRGYLGADNLGFAIPAATAREVVAALQRDGRVTRSYIGITPGALRDLESFFELELNTGMLVQSVHPGSPAARSGIRPGDIVLALNGQRVDGRFPEQLPPIQHRIATLPLGSELRLTVKRGATTQDFMVVTEALESRVGEELALERWGLSVRKVSRAFAREHQLPDDTGVVVIGVQRGFPAEVAGLSSGDVITKLNQRALTSLDVIREVHAAYEAQPAPVLAEVRRNFRVSLFVLRP
jgi:serine protease Do